jgi:hypothetical protein
VFEDGQLVPENVLLRGDTQAAGAIDGDAAAGGFVSTRRCRP